MKQSRRLLRSRLIGPERHTISVKDFQECMDKLLAAHIAAEEVEDNVWIRSELFEVEKFEYIKASLHYAVEYLHDIFEVYEKGHILPSGEIYELPSGAGSPCGDQQDLTKPLSDFLGDVEMPKSLELLADQLSRTTKVSARRKALADINSLRKSKYNKLRHREIAYKCVHTASDELKQAALEVR
jgi:hypothetical protein